MPVVSEPVLQAQRGGVHVVASRTVKLEVVALPLQDCSPPVGKVVTYTRPERQPETVLIAAGDARTGRGGHAGAAVSGAQLAEQAPGRAERHLADQAQVDAVGLGCATAAVDAAHVEVAQLQPEVVAEHAASVEAVGIVPVPAVEHPGAASLPEVGATGIEAEVRAAGGVPGAAGGTRGRAADLRLGGQAGGDRGCTEQQAGENTMNVFHDDSSQDDDPMRIRSLVGRTDKRRHQSKPSGRDRL